jgi:hypothetical protein
MSWASIPLLDIRQIGGVLRQEAKFRNILAETPHFSRC